MNERGYRPAPASGEAEDAGETRDAELLTTREVAAAAIRSARSTTWWRRARFRTSG